MKLEELGFYFLPYDKELIVDYLWRRVKGLPLPSGVICDANVSSTPPWELLAGREEAYFFSEQKLLRSSRTSRKMESGTWKKEFTGKEEMAFLDSGAVVHWKKSLFSFRSTGCDCSSGYVMREYQLCEPPSISDEKRGIKKRIKTPQSRWVLCKINVSQKALKRSREGQGARPGRSSKDAALMLETQEESLAPTAEPIHDQETSSSASLDCMSNQPLPLQEIHQIPHILDSGAYLESLQPPTAGDAAAIPVDDYGDYEAPLVFCKPPAVRHQQVIGPVDGAVSAAQSIGHDHEMTASALVHYCYSSDCNCDHATSPTLIQIGEHIYPI
ncbi:uncharacterized protein [Typha angustifolia]|uniref:uncharacterized protein n=1 Tax=Typha angustifolia TaxID=59011 RepID=UPI003C2C8FE6